MSDFLLNQFEVLDHQSKLAHLTSHGINLDLRKLTGNGYAALYQLYDFYVEVWYNEQDVITQLLPFNGYEQLDVYVQQIKINTAFIKG